MLGMLRLRGKTRSTAAFTLMEIILVVVIIGIMLTLVAPRITGRTRQAKETAARNQIKALETALQQFEFDVGDFPQNLESLIEKPSDVDDETWRGPYLMDNVVPKDPWKREYHYRTPGENLKDFDLWSDGKDGQAGTEDDITNWTKADQ